MISDKRFAGPQCQWNRITELEHKQKNRSKEAKLAANDAASDPVEGSSVSPWFQYSSSDRSNPAGDPSCLLSRRESLRPDLCPAPATSWGRTLTEQYRK